MRKIALLVVLSCVSMATYAVKIVNGPYLQALTDRSVTIVWTTDTDALSWVEIAPNDKSHFYAVSRPQYFETHIGRKIMGKVHKVTIDNLESGTTYRYRIYSREVLENNKGKILYGHVAATDVFRKKPLLFTTLDAGKASVSCLILNDQHGNSDLARQLANEFDKSTIGMLFYNGDMASSSATSQQVFEDFVNISVNAFAKETPFYMVRGNVESQGALGREYMQYFPTSTGKPYYIVRQGPVCFIVLDSGVSAEDSVGDTDFDAYRREQAYWLAEVLKSEAVTTAAFRVVMMHTPAVPSVGHSATQVHELFVPLLNEAKVCLMVSGNLHKLAMQQSGVGGANFPILVNSDKNIIRLSADGKTLNIVIKDVQGNEVNKFAILAQ